MSLNWNHFPDPEQSRKIVRDGVNARVVSRDGEQPPTPYQFLLYVMGAVYCRLQGDIRIDGERAARYVPKSKLHHSNPDDHKTALEAPLRAIAYFSWETERRVFLTRRVYPTYFDFLSVSYVPERWGALGVMLGRLQESVARGFNEPVRIHSGQELLPYLREAERLKYSVTLVVPIFRAGARSVQNLFGAIAFYVRSDEYLPKPAESEELEARLAAFGDTLSEGLSAHEQTIQKIGREKALSSLADLWLRELDKADNQLAIAKLTVELDESNPTNLDQVVASVMNELAGPLFYVALGDQQDDRTGVIWVACREDLSAGFLKDAVTRALGHACDGIGLVSFRVDLKGGHT